MSTTPNLNVTLIDSAQAQKEVTANAGFTVFDAALSQLSHTMTDADYTLSVSSTPQEWQYGVLSMTGGSLTATRNIIVPTNKKLYVLYNGTSGAQSLVLKTASGTGITVANGKTAILRCDGTNVLRVTADT